MSNITSSIPKGTDEFTTEVSGFFETLAKNWQAVVAVIVLAVIASGVGVFMMTKKEERVDQGRNALYLAEKNLDEQMKKMAQPVDTTKLEAEAKNAKDPKAANAARVKAMSEADAVSYQHFDVDAKLADTVKQLQAIGQDYPNTRPGYEATMLLGKLYLDHGQPAKAQEWFVKSTESAPTKLDKALAWSSAGYANENDGKFKEAIDAFDKAMAQGEGVIKGDVMMGKARSYQALKDNGQAKATYDQIISQLPNTEYAKSAESLKARLQ
jgi:tetratricopeptide (TPR) repeat protein